jgi:hypothetical protein
VETSGMPILNGRIDTLFKKIRLKKLSSQDAQLHSERVEKMQIHSKRVEKMHKTKNLKSITISLYKEKTLHLGGGLTVMSLANSVFNFFDLI